jgi:hypothetical protein
LIGRPTPFGPLAMPYHPEILAGIVWRDRKVAQKTGGDV